MRGDDELRLGRKRVGELQIDRRAARSEIDQRRVGKANVDAAGHRGDGRIGAFDQSVVANGLDFFEIVRIGDRAAGQIPNRRTGPLDRALELADAVEGQAGRRATLCRTKTSLALGDGGNGRCGWTRSAELQRDRVQLDADMEEERRNLALAKADRGGEICVGQGSSARRRCREDLRCEDLEDGSART